MEMHSVTAEAAIGMITDLGINSYFLAIDAMIQHLEKVKARYE